MKRIGLFPGERCESPKRNLSFDLFAALAAYLAMMLGQSVLSLCLSRALPHLAGTISLFGASLVWIPILFISLRIGGLRPAALYLSGEKAPRRLLCGLFIGIAMLAVLMLLLLSLGAYECVEKRLDRALYLPLLAFAFLVQGSAEELLCRGLLMSALCARYGGRVAAFGSALIFSLMHAANPSVTPLGLCNVFLFGLLFSSVTQRSGSLLAACGMHAGWNFALSVFGVQISGNAPRHSLLLLESRIPFLSGGGFGAEGSPILTVFLLLLLLIPVLFPKKSRFFANSKKIGKKMA